VSRKHVRRNPHFCFVSNPNQWTFSSRSFRSVSTTFGLRTNPELMGSFTRRKRAKYVVAIMCILIDLLLLLPVLLVGVQECRFYPIRKAEQFAPGRGPELHVSELGLYDNYRITGGIGRLYCSDNPIYCGKPISFLIQD